jgi:hypothetical protein
MVHILAPRPALAELPVFYNVDGAVGRDGVNSTADVLLVQFFMSLIGKNVPQGSPLAILGKVPVTGVINPDTIAAIEALQRADGATPDGRVSVANGYRFGGSFYTIMILNRNIKYKFVHAWPNVDELPGSSGLLNLACRRALVGTR